jgi:hypothetical protein
MPPASSPPAPAPSAVETRNQLAPVATAPESGPMSVSELLLQAERAKRLSGDVSAAPAPRRSHLWKSILHLTRRTHLYAGLLLCPWVFLYGITGFLFNHPEVWSDQTIVNITPKLIEGTDLAKLPAASEIAAQVVAAINANSTEKFTLVEPEKVRFAPASLTTLITDAKGKNHIVSLLANGTGIIRGVPMRPGQNTAAPGPTTERPKEAKPGRAMAGDKGPRNSEMASGTGNAAPAGKKESSEAGTPFAIADGLKTTPSPVEMIRTGLQAVLERVNMGDAKIGAVRIANPLTFTVAGAGKKWLTTYNFEKGSVSARDAALPPELPEVSFRRFLLRMHTAHGYPAEDMNMRWVWAVIVDIMAFVMVFWGGSGILMWWQIKRTRWIGAVCLIASTGAAIYIGIGMHELISIAGR